MAKFYLLQGFQDRNPQEKQNNQFHIFFCFSSFFLLKSQIYQNFEFLNNSKLDNSFQIQSLKLQKCKIVVSHQQLILHLTKEDGVIEWPFPMIRRSQMLNGWATPATKLATPVARLATPSWLTGALVINPKSLLIAFLARV